MIRAKLAANDYEKARNEYFNSTPTKQTKPKKKKIKVW